MGKGAYACVNGVSRKAKKIPVCVDGVSRQSKVGYTCVDGVSRQFFSGDSTISDLEVGQSVFIDTRSGGLMNNEFMIIHKGLPSSSYDSSCDGIWVIYKYPYENYHWASYLSRHYINSDINEHLNSSILGKFSSEIQNLIKQVTIPCKQGGNTSAKLFLLSYTEVMGTTNTYAAEEGTVLDYFNGATAEDRRGWTDADKDSTYSWWLRTQYAAGTASGSFSWSINNAGNADKIYKTDNYGHMRFAMILPHDTRIDENFNVIA